MLGIFYKNSTKKKGKSCFDMSDCSSLQNCSPNVVNDFGEKEKVNGPSIDFRAIGSLMASPQIVDGSLYDEVKLYLNRWADCFYRLENKYLSEKNGRVVRDYDFIRLVGESVYYLNMANSLIISAIEKFLSKTLIKGNLCAYELDLLDSYMRFYNNLIASKVKYYFFRETPIPNKNYPYMSINKEVVKSGWNLLGKLSSTSVDIAELMDVVYKYYYYQGLIYSFIFNDNGYGVFVDFNYSISSYKKVRSRISYYLESLLKGNGLRGVKLFIAKFSCGVMACYLKEDSDLCKNNEVVIRKPDCFNEFCEELAQRRFTVEPLTFRLIDILWKFNGIFAMERKDLLDPGKKKRFNDVCGNRLYSFVSDYLEKTDEMYSSGIVRFDQLYRAERKLFLKDDERHEKGLYEEVFVQESSATVRSVFNRQRNVAGVKKDLFTDRISFNDVRVSGKINSLNRDSENRLKLSGLIEQLEINVLLELLYGYACMIKSYGFSDDKDRYVAFYKSGVFLAHLVNLILGERKNIWLFSARPYVTTHPIHKDEMSVSFNRVVLFDESLKTGFTYTLYESYVLRNIRRSTLKVFLFTIFDFFYYDRVAGIDADFFNSLYRVDKSLVVEPIKRSFDDYNEGNQGGKVYAHKKISDVVRSLGLNSKGNEIDLVYLMSDTDSVFSICSEFRDIVMRKCPDKTKKIELFSPSENGEVLAMMTGLLLRLKGYSVKFLYNNIQVNRSSSYYVSIDLSITTGFSVDYRWSILSEKEYLCDLSGEDYFEKLEKDLDVVLAVYSDSKRLSDNTFVLYHNKDY